MAKLTFRPSDGLKRRRQIRDIYLEGVDEGGDLRGVGAELHVLHHHVHLGCGSRISGVGCVEIYRKRVSISSFLTMEFTT